MAHLQPAPDPKPRPAALIQSVDRAISVLELLAQHGQAGITEIADELGVHKSTVSRLISVLENRGRVEQLGERGKYALGFGLARLAAAGTRRLDLTTLSQPVCEDLARRLGETVNVAVLHDRAAIHIRQGFRPAPPPPRPPPPVAGGCGPTGRGPTARPCWTSHCGVTPRTPPRAWPR